MAVDATSWSKLLKGNLWVSSQNLSQKHVLSPTVTDTVSGARITVIQDFQRYSLISGLSTNAWSHWARVKIMSSS